MSEEMRVLQVKTERKELKELQQEEGRRNGVPTSPDLLGMLNSVNRRPSSMIDAVVGEADQYR